MITQSPDEASEGSGSGDEKCTSQSPKLMKVDCCSASSQYSRNNGCERAFDGSHRNEWVTKGEGEGSWIIANLVGNVSKFSYKQRTHRDDWNKDIRLEFSDGSSQNYQLQATADVQMFTLSKAVKTTFVKIVVVSTHNKLNNGAAEIEFFECSSGGSGGSGSGGEGCISQLAKCLFFHVFDVAKSCVIQIMNPFERLIWCMVGVSWWYFFRFRTFEK